MLDFFQTIAIIAIGAIVVMKEFPKLINQRGKQKMALMDSSALIDGRVVELSKAGFIPYKLAVPEFIVAELQLLADGNDSHKRERARFGLEVVQQLQRDPNVSVQIERTKVNAKTTDDKLVKLAKLIGADLFTTDFNLNQVANIEGIHVLNINELSHALRPVALPGEGFDVKIVQAGSSRDQGVGYMEDGTMVVIDGAKKDIGRIVKVRITRTHQTLAGKMLFANKISSESQHSPKVQSSAQKIQQQVSKPSTVRSASRKPVKSNTLTINSDQDAMPIRHAADGSLDARLRKTTPQAASKPVKHRQYSRRVAKPKSQKPMTVGEAALFSAIDDMSDN